MALTQRQVQLVQHSFGLVEPISEQATDIFYDALFKIDPSLKPLFRNNMKVQGRKLIAMLKAAVEGLDDLDALVPVLKQLAQRHNAYGVKKSHFTPVGNALLYTLKTGLGSEYTDEVRQAWILVIHVVSDTMKTEVQN
ncbi:globin domain-containing protein [Shewanella sp. D64]|uniref:globin family protein n=1 Tax=unclassified Shewanella TaxID=196818 RepID=UPI0022BA4EC5|nr:MULTISPECIES: globin family protein [unclassified Shewanella]MEC4727944.1 globin domain-containing protein [Shewanella sp. D64]MEC4740084.1 globin domain-containing protein [Shewanella sp. E94]WBJ95853.1 globin domain-containing protein [Shewanella sp. MTB7]